MRPLTYIPRYTVEDYQRWEGDWELIDGLPYAMSPSPKLRHQRLVLKLASQIDNSLSKNKKQCDDCIVAIDVDWVIDNNTIVKPDVAIVCNEKSDFITSAPGLIIEVLSPATAFKDRNVKFEIYRDQGVKYYLLVDPETKTCTIYQLINKQYKEEGGIPSFVIHDNCKVNLDIEKILAESGL